MQYTPGSTVTFVGAVPNNDTIGKVVRSEAGYLTILTRAGALITEREVYCKPYITRPLTLGDLRRMSADLPDDTLLFVDGEYRTSALGAIYDTWEVREPDTGKVHTRHAISLSHTMSNVTLKETGND
jgi:hypothetical protein